MSPALSKLAAFQELLSGRMFYGVVTVRFKAGVPVLVKAEQEYLMENLPQPVKRPEAGA